MRALIVRMTARAADPARAVPMELRRPEAPHPHAGERRSVIGHKPRDHRLDQFEALFRFLAILCAAHDAVLRCGCVRPAFAQLRTQRPLAGFDHQPGKIEQDIALHHPIALDPVEPAIADEMRTSAGLEAIEIVLEMADEISGGGDPVAILELPAHQDVGAPFQIGESVHERFPEARGHRVPPGAMIDRSARVEIAIGRIEPLGQRAVPRTEIAVIVDQLPIACFVERHPSPQRYHIDFECNRRKPLFYRAAFLPWLAPCSGS